MNRALLTRLLLTSALFPPTSCHVSYMLLHISLDRAYVVLEPLVLSLGPARQFHKWEAQGRAYSTSCRVKVMRATLADPERGSFRSEGDREHLQWGRDLPSELYPQHPSQACTEQASGKASHTNEGL